MGNNELVLGYVPIPKVVSYENDRPITDGIWGVRGGSGHFFQFTPEEAAIFAESRKLPDEAAFLGGKFILPKTKSAEVYLAVAGTECNLRCTGCAFGVGETVQGAMDEVKVRESLTRVIDGTLFNKWNMLKIKWSGGEPLLNRSFGVIQKTQPWLIDQMIKTGLYIDQVVISNGVGLTAEKADWLRDRDIPVSVSLWGVGEVNDRLRGVRNGDGNVYERVINNVRQAKDRDLGVSINYVVTPKNIGCLPELIKQLWDVKHPAYKDCLGVPLSLEIWRPQNQIELEKIYATHGYEKMKEEVRRGYAEILRLANKGVPVPVLSGVGLLDVASAREFTCGSGINYVAMDGNRIGACHQDMVVGQGVGDVFTEAALSLKRLGHKTNQEVRVEAESLGINHGLMAVGALGCPRLWEKDSKKGEHKMLAELLPESAYIAMATLPKQENREKKRKEIGWVRLEGNLDEIAAPALVAFQNPEVNKYLSKNLPKDEAQIRQWFDDMQENCDICWPIKHGQMVLGHATLKNINYLEHCFDDKPLSAEVAVVVYDPKKWGRGIAEKAMKELFREAKAMGIFYLTAKIVSENLASRRLFEKLWFKNVGADKNEPELLVYTRNLQQEVDEIPIYGRSADVARWIKGLEGVQVLEKNWKTSGGENCPTTVVGCMGGEENILRLFSLLSRRKKSTDVLA